MLLSASFSFKAFQKICKQSRKQNEISDIKSVLLWRLQLCECSFLFFKEENFFEPLATRTFIENGG